MAAALDKPPPQLPPVSGNSSYRLADRESVDLVCPFVGEDGLQVVHVPDDRIFERYAVGAEKCPRLSSAPTATALFPSICAGPSNTQHSIPDFTSRTPASSLQFEVAQHSDGVRLAQPPRHLFVPGVT